jgi:hypothetical protein
MDQRARNIINLPAGKWQIFVNGEEGELNINSVDPNGIVKGKVFGSKISLGAYNSASGQIFFSRIRPEKIFPPWTELYYGHTSTDSSRHTVDTPSSIFMAGSYFTIPPREERSYGWYATAKKMI